MAAKMIIAKMLVALSINASAASIFLFFYFFRKLLNVNPSLPVCPKFLCLLSDLHARRSVIECLDKTYIKVGLLL